MPIATALLVSFTVPEGGGSAAIASVNTAMQLNATSHFEVICFNIALSF